MGREQRLKGHNFERKMARLLTERTGHRFRRGLQTRGGGLEVPDVACDNLPFHIECKKGKKPPWRGALRQAEQDSDDKDIRKRREAFASDVQRALAAINVLQDIYDRPLNEFPSPLVHDSRSIA